MAIIDDVIEKEWEMAKALMGPDEGPADGEGVPPQFVAERKSQFLTWPEDILYCYYNDLAVAEQEGRNLNFEKTLWMIHEMEPDKFDAICASMPSAYTLPEILADRRTRIKQSAAIQAEWAESFAEKYPALGKAGRAPRAEGDTPSAPSVETYFFGELCSLSDFTEISLSKFIVESYQTGRNLYEEVQENLAKELGFESLDELEEKQSAATK